MEWIVVDNASDDDSILVAEKLGARVIPLSDNLGFGAANNVGFEQSSGAYVAFVNPDVTVDFDHLEMLQNVIDDENALVAPQLVNTDGTLQPNGRGWPFLAHKIQHRISPAKLNGTYRLFAANGEICEVDWLTGAVVAGKKTTFQKLGPWDPTFFLYYEDTDLCMRAIQAGHRCLIVGSSNWVHGWQRDTSSFKLAPWKREVASMAKFYSRYPKFLSIIPHKTSARINARRKYEMSA